MSIDYKRLVLHWMNEVWNRRNEAIIDEMMSADCVVRAEGADGTLTRDDFRTYRRVFLSAVPDMHVQSLAIATEGETSVQQWRVTGTHLGHGLGIPPSGRRVDFTGMSIYEFRDEIIVGGTDHWNRGEVIASLMQVRIEELRTQAGLTPREAQVALLMAERFTHSDIAMQLCITPNTSRRHCERVLMKLGVRRRQDVGTALGKIPGSVLDRHGADLVGAG